MSTVNQHEMDAIDAKRYRWLRHQYAKGHETYLAERIESERQLDDYIGENIEDERKQKEQR